MSIYTIRPEWLVLHVYSFRYSPFFIGIYELIVNFYMKILVKVFLLVYNSRALAMKGWLF